MEQSNSRVSAGLDASHSQQLVGTIATQLQDSRNSRILNRKQIEKRMQNLKPAQYEKVIYNLSSQNKILQQEVRDLHDKVEQLMIAKKIPNPHHRNPLMQEQVKKAKKQLALKYESMNYLKEQLRKSKQSQLTEQMKNKIMEQKNEIIGMDIQIEKMKKQRDSLSKQFEGNQQALEQFLPKTQNQDERMNGLREQNKNIKLKIQQLNEKYKITEKSSQEALDKFYNLKQEEQKFMKALMESKNSKKKLTMTDLKAINMTELNVLEKEVEQLRKQKKEAEKELVNEKIIKDQRKAKIEKEARQNIEIHKDLLKKRMKVLNQLNLYEAKDKKQRQIIEAKQQEQEKIHCEERGCQTDKIIPIDFRKQWIGNNEGLAFDDSLILDYRSHVYVKSLIIYKTADYISFIKFFYQNNQKKRYETKVPFDSSLLRKLESKKYVAKGGAFLKSFKAYLTSDRVTKIDFVWSDGEVSTEGWQTDGSTKFTADIDANQRPISMFGTLSFQGKNSYALQSLGCEINKIDQDE